MKVKLPILVALPIAIMLSGFAIAYELFARPRGFKGDFYAAMFTSDWWDGTGVFYGPIFVFERWLVDLFPSVFTIQFFAFGCIVLIGTAFIGTSKIVSYKAYWLTLSTIVWGLNSYLYYSFSVAANPELIELNLLIIMWWGLVNKRYHLAWIMLTLAVLTKLAPLIIAPIVFFYFSWLSLGISLTVGAFILALVSLGQRQSILDTISQLLSVNQALPQPFSEQFLGLDSAVARMLGLNDKNELSLISNLSEILICILLGLAILVSYRVFHSLTIQNHQTKVTLMFAIFLSLLPIAHLTQTHRHTYLFLAPVFIAFGYVLKNDPDHRRSGKYRIPLCILFISYSVLPIYLLDLYNFNNFENVHFATSIKTAVLMLTEPVWTNMVLFFLLINYAIKLRGKTNSNSVETLSR